MRVESPFFDKSSSRFILTRARGLGILTFSEIRKTLFGDKISNLELKILNITTFCQKIILLKNIYKFFCFGDFFDRL